MTQNNKQLTHIGTSEFIDFPDDAVFNVPAKIDTGADSSAIWASDIAVEDGVLTFNFFAPGSVFYKPEPTRTAAFKSTVIKNSFGHREVRYKIRLKVRVGTRKFATWFSLADRSRNTYPVLLGKTFLKNRFIVDVSQSLLFSPSRDNRRVLVLDNRPETKDFFTQVRANTDKQVEFVCARYDALRFEINGAYTRIVNTTDKECDLSEYDLVYFKSHIANAEFAATAAEYLRYKSRRFIDREVANYTSASKLSEAMRLVTHNVLLPRSIVAKTSLLLESYDQVVETIGSPFVLKEIASDRGRNNYLVSNTKEFHDILTQANLGHIYMAQEYIENDGFLRLNVFGNDMPLAVWRASHTHADPLKRHLNKPTGGVNASKLADSELSPEVVNSAVAAASYMGRQVAGVDMVQDKRTKQWYILEVNYAPQLWSGSFVGAKAEAVARFFEKELNR
ncbi:MAG TPA: RimK/LysX family protein [Candidatus Saccharimonadia bacterium]|nr:RimK/LysX family protein [Candidatus Saccharimonadia bacterium]